MPDSDADRTQNESSGPHAALRQALEAQQIVVSDDALELLDRYRELLWDWNERINLTRHTTIEKFVERDVLDSVQLARLLEPGERVLDVGSGSGVPGIILAIVRPDLEVTLIEQVAKKANALESIVRELGLPIRVLTARVQDHLGPQHTYDTLVARALARLDQILRWLRPHAASYKRVLLIKGPQWVEERGEARHLGLLRNLELRRVASYPMPGTDSETTVLQVTRGTGESQAE